MEQSVGAYMLSKYTEPDAVDRRRSFDPFIGCSVVLSREFSTATLIGLFSLPEEGWLRGVSPEKMQCPRCVY